VLLVLGPAPAAAGTSSARDPQVTFDTPGTKSVTLQVCNALGCSTVTHTVQVLDPAPDILGASLTPDSIEPGELVTLTAAATGRPSLTYSWLILRGTTPVATLGGATATFATGGQPPGAYTATLTVTNAEGPPAVSAPLPLTLRTGTPTDFYTVPPCRVLDTRAGWPVFAGLPKPIQVAGKCGIPADARAITANVTAIAPSVTGSLVLYPSNLLQPSTTTVSFIAGQTRASFAVLPLAIDGSGLTALAPTATVDLALDVSGYFAAPP
jgi:hypothetical protein